MDLECRAPLTYSQWQWLQTTNIRIRRIQFHRDDVCSSMLLEDHSVLVRTPVTLFVAGPISRTASEKLGTDQASHACVAAEKRYWCDAHLLSIRLAVYSLAK